MSDHAGPDGMWPSARAKIFLSFATQQATRRSTRRRGRDSGGDHPRQPDHAGSRFGLLRVEEPISRDQLYIATKCLCAAPQPKSSRCAKLISASSAKAGGPVTRACSRSSTSSQRKARKVGRVAGARAGIECGGSERLGSSSIGREKNMKKHRFRRETEAVRVAPTSARKTDRSPAIYQTSTFEAPTCRSRCASFHRQLLHRYGNPTNTVVENAIAELEGADAALLFSSGMAAITTSILSLVKAGDHIVAQRDIYGGVIRFLSTWLPSWASRRHSSTPTTSSSTSAPFAQHKLLHIESPTIHPARCRSGKNRRPGAQAQHDYHHRFHLCHAHQLPSAEWGIDLVLHSGTKYFPGIPI